MEEGPIVYRFKTPRQPNNILYVNTVANYSCPNSCTFCGREAAKEGKPTIYEKKARVSLYLRQAPSIEQVVDAVAENLLPNDEEIAFVGLGEPLLNFALIRLSTRLLKRMGYAQRIRVDTDGLVKCWYHGNPAPELKDAGMDELRISVNAVNEYEYNQLCRPSSEDAYRNLKSFIADTLATGIETKISFVIGFKGEGSTDRSVWDYLQFGKSLGIEPKNILTGNFVEPILSSED